MSIRFGDGDLVRPFANSRRGAATPCAATGQIPSRWIGCRPRRAAPAQLTVQCRHRHAPTVPNDLSLVQVESNGHVEIARALFREYEASLQVDLCFQSFEDELSALPATY